jgi:hypothetical protein
MKIDKAEGKEISLHLSSFNQPCLIPIKMHLISLMESTEEGGIGFNYISSLIFRT